MSCHIIMCKSSMQAQYAHLARCVHGHQAVLLPADCDGPDLLPVYLR
jgi:hypothetical protein